MPKMKRSSGGECICLPFVKDRVPLSSSGDSLPADKPYFQRIFNSLILFCLPVLGTESKLSTFRACALDSTN